MKELGIPEKHMLKVARDSMRYACVALRFIGGPNHIEAQENIKNLTGKIVPLPDGCTCQY